MKFINPVLFALTASALSVPEKRESKSADWRFVGRVNPETSQLTWPSTGVNFTFEGTTASIAISNVQGKSSASLFIDDQEPIVISEVSGGSIDLPKLPEGRHTVELRKRSETNFGTFRITDVKTQGKLIPTKAPERKIEIVGDSISVGYGLDGVLGCSDSAQLQNNPKTYGALAAKALGADYSVVAWSGKGLTRNYPSGGIDTSPLMPQLYTRYGSNDADNSFDFPSSWRPDAVVINLGTNDFAVDATRDAIDPAKLTEALVKLVRLIHGHYEEAEFFLVSSPNLGDDWPPAEKQHSTHVKALKDAINQLAEDNVKGHLVDWPTQGSETGCDYHPNAATHAIGAGVLVESIKDALKW